MMQNSVTAFYGSNELAKNFTDKGNSKKIAWTAGITAALATLRCENAQTTGCCDGKKDDEEKEKLTD